MITLSAFYHVMTAMVPLYVAMILAYGSVRWWKIFSPEQCAGINRFVALFAVPFLSFHFISKNNPYEMNLRFLAADTLQKLIVLAILTVWTKATKRGSLEWMITLFSLSTLPNTLVMGIPLLDGMYGNSTGTLMVQIVVLQCIIWYTLMIVMFEYRAAKALISEQFPGITAASIVSIHVDSDVVSLDGRQALETETEAREDGRLRVTVRKSSASRSDVFSRRSQGLSATPRPSNLTNAEIYSLQSSRNATPRGSSFNHSDFYSMVAGGRSSNFGSGDIFGVGSVSSRRPTPRPSNYEEDAAGNSKMNRFHYNGAAPPPAVQYPAPNPGMFSPSKSGGSARKANGQVGGKDLHMFVWSSNASPVSDVFGGATDQPVKELRVGISPGEVEDEEEYGEGEEIALGSRGAMENGQEVDDQRKVMGGEGTTMPPASVMTRLILIMIWRKLIRNPNTYSSLIGLIWSLVAFKLGWELPAIIAKSISILSDAGLGMAMFGLGLFMALQPRLIACGNSLAAFALAVRFLVGPAITAAASAIVGLRGNLLRIAIVQATLPQGIVPFVFAKEYNIHADILSTAVIFGMLVAVPVTIVYYILLGL